MSEYRPQYGAETTHYEKDYQPPYDAPGQKQGMSGCAKLFLILAVLGVLALLTCCIGGGLYVRRAVTTDPIEIMSIANDIVDWDMNQELTGQFAFEGPFDTVRMAMLAEPERGILMLVDTRFANTSETADQVDRSFKGKIDTDERLSEKTEVIEEEERELEIRGEQWKLQFNHTRGLDSGKEYWEVAGVVPGKRYTAFVMLKVLTSAYDKDQVWNFFQSIE